jgi:TonB-linked SusC/RagA family outer membrane protein
MKKKHTIILAFLGVILLSFPHSLTAQKESRITVEAVVSDEMGNPVNNAEIFSDGAFTRTDVSGRFSIKIVPGSKLIIEANGFESIALTQNEVQKLSGISLKKAGFLYSDKDKVDLAFRNVYEGDVVGFVSRINADKVNAFDYTAWASDVFAGRTLGMLGGNTIRGIGIGINVADITGSGFGSGNALFVVDGLPRDIGSLRLSEIEDITVLKDVNAAILYGTAAINGVVLITTKRGEAYKKRSDFTASYGISTPRAFPKYLNSADYMTYYNKARQNEGLTPLYTEATIENYRSGNKFRYPSVDYYSDEYLKPFKSYFDLMGEFSGGNDVAKFYSNIGWLSEGSLLDFGEATNARLNQFNIRGNVDLKINNWIKTSIDATSVFLNNKSQRGSFWSAASTVRPYEFTPLLPFDLIDPENSLLKGRKNDVEGKYLLGGNSNFLTNAIADCYSGGIYERISRTFSFNNRIDFDLDKLMKGLSFHTNISFDYYTSFDQTVANQYSVYEPVWSATEDKITSLVQSGTDARPGTQVVGNTTFQRRFGFYGLFSYDRVFRDLHHVTGSLFGYASMFKEQEDFQGIKNAHLGLQITYVFDKKYMVDFSSAYVNSVRLPEGNKGGLSPSLGLSWVLSSENFLASVKNIDYLKLRLSGGILNSDFPIGGFFYYDNRYGTSGSYAWYEGGRSRSGVLSSWRDNPELNFAKRNEVNLGVEGLLFNKLLGFEANLFYDVYNNLVVRRTASYPPFYTNFIPYENYNADMYKGAEVGLNLNKSVGNWTFFIGATMLYVTSERTKVDEIYNNGYQYRQGHPVDATFGLEALGLFSDQPEIDNSPRQLFGTVKPGDIRYKDQNNDGVVDANDEVYLRRYQAPLSGGLQVKLSWKNVSLFVLGEGRAGSESFKEGDYYWVDGNKKYSEVVPGAWTPDTKETATYPRLSSQTNSNNFRRSSYWLYNNDYFNIRKVQVTWNLPETVTKAILMKNMDLFIDAYDVWQFAKNREIRDLSTGSEPYYRSFSVGIKANF